MNIEASPEFEHPETPVKITESVTEQAVINVEGENEVDANLNPKTKIARLPGVVSYTITRNAVSVNGD